MVTRGLFATLVVAALAFGIWTMVPRDEVPPTTAASAYAQSTTSTAEPSTTTSLKMVTTTNHVVTTEAKAEEILRELWLGWFEGIYNQDEGRVREVVATQSMLDAARDLFGELSFTAVPTSDGIEISQIEILKADRTCTAVWAVADATGFRDANAVGEGVWVLRQVDGEWRMATLWNNKGDLWDTDCSSELSSLS